MKPIEEYTKAFSAKEKQALEVLAQRGFIALAEVKLEDARELETGSRMRTFRHSRVRHALALVLTRLEKPAPPKEKPAADPEPAEETPAADPEPAEETQKSGSKK